MNSIDIFVQNYFSLVRTKPVTELMIIFSSFFDLSLYSILATFCITFLIYLVKGLRYSLLFISTVSVGVVIVYFLKLLFDVSRPTDTVLTTFGQSFPSYHATIASIFFIMLMYIFYSRLKILPRVLFSIFCVASIPMVAFSRVYLGVHWVSDVLFGLTLGFIISYFSIRLFKYLDNLYTL